MDAVQTVSFLFLTIGLVIGLGVAFASSFRTSIAYNWEKERCSPGVVPIAGFFKPDADPRTRAEFAADNWRSCQKEYVQTALRSATAATKDLASAQHDTAELTQSMTDGLGDLFVDLWGFCYEAYSTFMTNMGGVAKLFHNQLISMHSMVGRMSAAVTSLVFGLISTIVAFISGIQLVVTIVIIVVGILLIMQILLFFLLMPISSLILSMSALVMSVAVMVATTVAAVSVGEMFDTVSGTCFAEGTPVILKSGKTIPIEKLHLGTELEEGCGTIIAIHEFWNKHKEPVFDVEGIRVTGDHLIYDDEKRLHPVSEDSRAIPTRETPERLWCLTTSSRVIPVQSKKSSKILYFADWEEIEETDINSQRTWYNSVWQFLNSDSGKSGGTVEELKEEILQQTDSGLSPSCCVAVQTISSWWSPRCYRWIPISEVKPGDYIATNAALTDFTPVIGKVIKQENQVNHIVRLGTGYCGEHQIVSATTWIRSNGKWLPTAFIKPISLLPHGDNTKMWYHLYTESGTFLIEGGWIVRDASDVGLANQEKLVEEFLQNKK